MKARSIKYLITFAVGAVISAAVFSGSSLLSLTDKADIYRVLCNGFFVSGALLAGLGVLALCSAGGTFDMLAYGVVSLFALFSRDMKTRYGSFYNYRLAKSEKRPEFLHLLLVGAVYLIAATVFLLLFNGEYQ